MSFWNDLKDHLTHPGDLKKGHTLLKRTDPLLTRGTEALMRGEDKVLSKVWGAAGNDEAAGMFEDDSKDSSRAYQHRGIAGLATLGAMALGGAGGGAGAGSGGAGGASAESAPGWLKWAQLGSQASQTLGGGQQQRAQEFRAELSDPDPHLERLMLDGGYVTSTKSAKKPSADVAKAIDRGIRLENPIDANGVQVAAIQALTKQVEHTRQRIAALKRVRAKGV